MLDFSNKEEVTKKLNELKNMNLPHMTIEQFSKINKSFAEEIQNASTVEREIIEEYLYPFYRSEELENKCIFTDCFPSLQWALTHGTAIDCETGLSWKCYHYLIINGKERRYDTTLQYHPDCYEV